MSLYSSSWGLFLAVGFLTYPQFVLDLGVPLPWFFIITGLFTVNYVDIIILECYPGWLPSKTCWTSMGYFSVVQEDPLDLSSVRLDRCHCQSVHGQICGAVLRCGAVSLCWVRLFQSRRLFIIGGPFRIVCNIYKCICLCPVLGLLKYSSS